MSNIKILLKQSQSTKSLKEQIYSNNRIYYHISLKDFDTFQENKKGIFLTPHLYFFKEFGYVNSQKAIIYSCRIKPVNIFNPTKDWKKLLNYLLQNPYEFNEACNHNLLYWNQTIRLYLGYHQWQAGEHSWLRNALQNLQYDGFTVTESAIGNIAIFDPQNIVIIHKLYMKDHNFNDLNWDSPKPIAGKLYDYFFAIYRTRCAISKSKTIFYRIICVKFFKNKNYLLNTHMINICNRTLTSLINGIIYTRRLNIICQTPFVKIQDITRRKRMSLQTRMEAKNTQEHVRENVRQRLYKNERTYRMDKLVEAWSRIPEVGADLKNLPLNEARNTAVNLDR